MIHTKLTYCASSPAIKQENIPILSEKALKNTINTEHKYGVNGRMVQTLVRKRNNLTNEWSCKSKYEYQYDDLGNLCEKQKLIWSTQQECWVSYYKRLYIYSTLGHVVEEIEQKWLGGLGRWVNEWRFICTYDQVGNNTSHLQQEWDWSTNDWTNRIKYIFDYNGNEVINYEQA